MGAPALQACVSEETPGALLDTYFLKIVKQEQVVENMTTLQSAGFNKYRGSESWADTCFALCQAGLDL